MDKKRLLRVAATAGFIVIFLVGLYYFIGKPMIAFVGDREAFNDYVASRGLVGWLIFGLFVFLQTLSTCIPGLPFYLAAGAVLGGLKGALLCDVFATLGNTVAFIIGKRFGRGLLTYVFTEEKVKHVEELILDKKPMLVHVMFMLLPLPKDTYAWLGFYSKENLIQWIIITFIARFPHIFLYTYGAEQVLDNQYGFIVVGGVIAVIVYLVVMLRLKKK